MRPTPKPWQPWLGLALLALTVLLQSAHIYIEVSGHAKHFEGDIAVTTLLVVLGALALWGFWLVANMIRGKIMSTTQVMELTYRLGWHDRDLLATEHHEPPSGRPDLRLLRFDNEETAGDR